MIETAEIFSTSLGKAFVTMNKTSVESVKLGKTLDSSTCMSLGCCWKSFTPS